MTDYSGNNRSPQRPSDGDDSTAPVRSRMAATPIGSTGRAQSQLGAERAVVPGTVLKERFVIEELIAEGGMGDVFKARDLRKQEAFDRNPYVAVKVLTQQVRQHPDAWLALQREARKAQSLAHPNVLTVYDFDREGSNVFMTMEYLQGEPLSDLIEKVQPNGMDKTKALSIIEAIGEALKYAQRRGIVHCDLKPSNVFVTREGVVKVLDFGIARAVKRPGYDPPRPVSIRVVWARLLLPMQAVRCSRVAIRIRETTSSRSGVSVTSCSRAGIRLSG